MSIKFEYITDMDVSAYWLPNTDKNIYIILDNLMKRKNESITSISKKIIRLHLQELICQEYHKDNFTEEHCKNVWCPMRYIAQKMLL